MALYLFSCRYVSRRQGRSFIGAAAYRSGQKLLNPYDRLSHDYSKRRDVIHAEVLLPANAPQEYFDLQNFCDAVELAEKRRDARTAREIVIALPQELSFDTSVLLAKDFINHCFVKQGMCALLAVHRGDNKSNVSTRVSQSNTSPHNPHAHILLSTRTISPDGFSDYKNRDWDKRELLILWREEWATIQNRYLARKGFPERVSHESYATRDLDRESTFHLGPVLSAMERSGIKTRLGDVNRSIEERNHSRELTEPSYEYDRSRSR